MPSYPYVAKMQCSSLLFALGNCSTNYNYIIAIQNWFCVAKIALQFSPSFSDPVFIKS